MVAQADSACEGKLCIADFDGNEKVDATDLLGLLGLPYFNHVHLRTARLA